MQEEWGRRQINDTSQAEFAVHGFQAGNPQPGSLIILLGFLAVIAFQFFLVVDFGLLTITVVGLIVEYEDVFHSHQIGHHPLKHLAVCFQGVKLLAPPLQ